MTELLLPAIRKAKGRVINVASSSSTYACVWSNHDAESGGKCMDEGHLQDIVTKPVTGRNTFMIPAANYGVSKYLMVYHAHELAKREAANGVTAYSLHPGVVKTGMMKPVPNAIAAVWCQGQKPCMFTPQEGGATLAYLSSWPLPTIQRGVGKYWIDCTPAVGVMENRVTRTSQVESDKYSADVYAKSLTWVGLSGPPAPVPTSMYACVGGVCVADPTGIAQQLCIPACGF